MESVTSQQLIQLLQDWFQISALPSSLFGRPPSPFSALRPSSSIASRHRKMGRFFSMCEEKMDVEHPLTPESLENKCDTHWKINMRQRLHGAYVDFRRRNKCSAWKVLKRRDHWRNRLTAISVGVKVGPDYGGGVCAGRINWFLFLNELFQTMLFQGVFVFFRCVSKF